MKRIARILGEDEDRVATLVNALEEKNGFPSHDVRYLAENVQKIHSKITDLGLDPDDTTGEELFHALLVKFEKDSNVFDVYSVKILNCHNSGL
jgi:ribosome assembly protein YihI (activator of Der GTPase)